MDFCGHNSDRLWVTKICEVRSAKHEVLFEYPWYYR